MLEARDVSTIEAVVKVFCVHTQPNMSMPWQMKRQYSTTSSGFVTGARRVWTCAYFVEHHTHVTLRNSGRETKYVATVLAIGTECDVGEGLEFVGWALCLFYSLGLTSEHMLLSLLLIRTVVWGIG